MKTISEAIKGILKGVIAAFLIALALTVFIAAGSCFGEACDWFTGSSCVFAPCVGISQWIDNTIFVSDESVMQTVIYILAVGALIGAITGVARGISLDKQARLEKVKKLVAEENGAQNAFTAAIQPMQEKAGTYEKDAVNTVRTLESTVHQLEAQEAGAADEVLNLLLEINQYSSEGKAAERIEAKEQDGQKAKAISEITQMLRNL
ncbi:MAG: hypothetical protein ACI4LH_06670 [Candidatus Heritagella sp.]